MNKNTDHYFCESLVCLDEISFQNCLPRARGCRGVGVSSHRNCPVWAWILQFSPGFMFLILVNELPRKGGSGRGFLCADLGAAGLLQVWTEPKGKNSPGAKGGLRLEGLVQNSLWDLVLEDLSLLGAARPKKLKFNLSL